MKITLQKTINLFLVLSLLGSAKSQTISTFENMNLGSNKYWNGRDFSKGFTSGNAFFTNFIDTTFGDYWEGFAASTTSDDSTPGYSNQYSSITAKGYNNSNTYAVMYKVGTIRLNGDAKGKQISGFYITNSTYAYLDMLKGSGFSKKFGGASGNEPDFFQLIVKGWHNGNPKLDSVNFYLADFRSTDNSKDYIIKNWTWLDLTKLGDLDSLGFYFLSSDTGTYGINTPQYFCMDNFTTLNVKTGLSTVSENIQFNLFPNPANQNIQIETDQQFENIKVLNTQGQEMISTSNQSIDISSLLQGVYLLQVQTSSGIIQKRFLKQ